MLTKHMLRHLFPLDNITIVNNPKIAVLLKFGAFDKTVYPSDHICSGDGFITPPYTKSSEILYFPSETTPTFAQNAKMVRSMEAEVTWQRFCVDSGRPYCDQDLAVK
jgi:hypothetical protein